jgi:hypothetical protein
MKGPWAHVSGLLDLHKLADAQERRATWRQSIASLGTSSDEGPSPLEGLHPEALAKGVKVAITDGLVDDLDWLAPSAAGAALYALAAALPLGWEQREVGRRVLARLNAGDAETVLAMTTRMALGAGKGLANAPVRARIALAMELPIGLGTADGPLALALCSARELAREWISIPSTGSLPARRLAARLIERAAREASKRAQQGDDHALRIFKGDVIRDAWGRLFDDRESLVWRHVAVARGLVAPWMPAMKTATLGAMAQNLSPTEWRRGATSLAAMTAVAPEAALRAATIAITAGILDRDRGVGAAFVWGISRAAEAEPDAAGTLLNEIMTRAPADAAEAVSELFAEFGAAPFVERAAAAALAALKTGNGKTRDDGAAALERELSRDLNREKEGYPPMRDQIAAALDAFASRGARDAYLAARGVLSSAGGALDTLDALARDVDEDADGEGGTKARRTSLAVMRDLDITLLEKNVLADLLKIGGTDGGKQHDAELDGARERLAEWILGREAVVPVASPRAAFHLPGSIEETLEVVAPPQVPHLTLRLRRLRALLHLVDSDVGSHDDSARGARLRKRWFRIASALLARVEANPPEALRRTLFAALARAFDALVRADALDVTDVLLVVAGSFKNAHELTTLAEASMDPDLIHVLRRYATFMTASGAAEARTDGPDSGAYPSLRPSELAAPLSRADGILLPLDELARELIPHASSRGEALRTALVRLHAALKAVAAASSLRALSSGGTEPDVVSSLETALAALSQLSVGAHARLQVDHDPRDSSIPVSASGNLLSVAVARVLSGAEPSLTVEKLTTCELELLVDVPPAVALVVSALIAGLPDRPTESASDEAKHVRAKSEQLPAWVPPRRTLGGFYIVRALGSGASGSVFVVNRVEDRHDAGADKFALKVPDYSATAARMLSEAEFLQMFRAEASALIAVPQHENLAHFVTFDLAARPKPILVMELVEGSTLEQVVESRGLDMARCFAVLDDVLCGLEAMHSVGVGHLDVKPSNVVLRNGTAGVLVDFGLAGRHIRPGCGSGPYGAPEVWGAGDEIKSQPSSADVYSFGCLAFETFTGRLLFKADSEMAQIAGHITHDGFPPLLKALAANAVLAPLAEVLFSTLRRNPENRPPVARLRSELKQIAPQFSRMKWPLSV